MMNLFNKNRKTEPKEIKIKITWINGEVEYTTGASVGIASLIADPCVDKVERV